MQPKLEFCLCKKGAINNYSRITNIIWGCPNFLECMVIFLRGNIAQLLSLKMSLLRYEEKELFTTGHCPKWAKTEFEARLPANLSSYGLLTSSFCSPLAVVKFGHTKSIILTP